METRDLRPSSQEQPAREPLRTELFAAVLASLPVGVTVETQDGQRVFANEAAAAQSHGRTGQDPPDDAITNGAIQQVGSRVLQTYRSTLQLPGEAFAVSTVIDVTERMQVENELLRRVYYDDLTGLPNRSLVQHNVETMLARGGGRFALGFIDIDNFKHINDYYSHAIGDALLVRFAQRVAKHLRPSDTLARISGDEFVLVIDPVGSIDELEAAINQLVEQLQLPFMLDGFEVFTSASIGISLYPEHGCDYEVLRRNADSAMYRAKGNAKGGVVFFDLSMGHAVTARMESEQRLRLAIRDRQFCCAFQPKVDIRTREVIGLEALIRWRDDRGEFQGPGEFISLAVELGLIDQITHMMLEQSVQSMDIIDDAFGPNTSISINVAAKQAGNLEFMCSFAEALAATGRAERFMIELTEDAFIAKSQFQTEVLPLLRALGVRVSIDDFGTGYSSLSALADITADEIKIDRSFITDIHRRPRSQSVLKAIESLSVALGMTMLAEGVETADELAYLQAATRIRYAQGYYFAKPLFLADVASLRDLDVSRRAASSSREQPESRVARVAGGGYSRRG